jgi:hypothetical protein
VKSLQVHHELIPELTWLDAGRVGIQIMGLASLGRCDEKGTGPPRLRGEKRRGRLGRS